MPAVPEQTKSNSPAITPALAERFEPRQWGGLIRVMVSRLLILGSLFFVLVVIMPHDNQAFYAFIALAFVINIPYALWLRKDAQTRQSAPLQFLCDALIATGLVHFTGGIRSDLFLLYPLVTLSAGIVISSMHALKISLISICLYSTLVILEFSHVLVYRGLSAFPYDDGMDVAQCLSLRIFILVFFSLAGKQLAERCTYQSRQLGQYREQMQALFDHMAVGLLSVSPAGIVLFANRRAEEMAGVPEGSLKGQIFADLFISGAPALNDSSVTDSPPPSGGGGNIPAWYLRQPADGRLPVGVSRSVAKFGLNDGDGRVTSDAELGENLYLFALRDMSAEIYAAAALRRMQGLEVAFQVGTELAHSIRNPLTAVRCGCDGIHNIIRERTAAGATFDGDDRTILIDLSEIVGRQIEQINTDMDTFLQHVSDNPAEFLKMAAEAREKYCPKDSVS